MTTLVLIRINSTMVLAKRRSAALGKTTVHTSAVLSAVILCAFAHGFTRVARVKDLSTIVVQKEQSFPGLRPSYWPTPSCNRRDAWSSGLIAITNLFPKKDLFMSLFESFGARTVQVHPRVSVMSIFAHSLFIIAAAAVALIGSTAGSTHSAPLSETVTVAANQPIPNVPGMHLVSLIVDYPPGARSLPHRHAPSAFIYAYVLSGQIQSQVDGEPVRVYRAGEAWFEGPGAHHRVSANASDTEPARLLAVFIVDAADEPLTKIDSQQ